MQKPPDSTLTRLGRGAARHRRLVTLGWVVLLVVSVIAGPKIAGEWSVDYGTPGSDSKAATEQLRQAFPQRSGDDLQVVWHAEGGVATRTVQAQVQRTLDKIAREPSIPQADVRQARISPDGKTGMLLVPMSSRTQTVVEQSGPALVAASQQASNDQVQLRLGGFVIRESERGAVSSENVGLIVALGILLLTFGSVIAAGLPIATAVMGIAIASAGIGALAHAVDTPDWAESLAVMVGIGVGIDYALLILTRYRAALAAGVEVEDAIAGSMATAGRSVLVAGSTVVVALMGLLLMRLPYLTGVAIAASLSVLVVMFASLTLLPALLGFAGHRINSLGIRMPWRRRRDHAEVGDADPRFARWSTAVQERPWRATATGLVVLGLLTAPLAGVWIGFPGLDTDPTTTQARQAADLSSQGFGPGAQGPMEIVVPAATAEQRQRIPALRRDLAADPRIVAVSEPERSADGSIALISAQGTVAPANQTATDLLHHVRDDIVPRSGTGALVGGWTALSTDQSETTAARLPLLFIGVAGLSALLLLLAMRSIWVPVKAAVLNLLSILAAYGVVALVAEGGAFGQLFGVDTATPIPPFIPVLMFAVLFGLSMDYEVFLIGRIRELWLRTGDAQQAIAGGLAATARVITAAALIMVAVFGAFAFADEIFLKLIGIGMAVAIFVDATVIRLLLVPAIMSLLGERAWRLPGWLDRLLPHADLEGGWEPGATPAERATADQVAEPASA